VQRNKYLHFNGAAACTPLIQNKVLPCLGKNPT